MGDNGELYSCYDESMVLAMRKLVARANIICPNYTEACFLAGKKPTAPKDETTVHKLCQDLHALGSKEVIITSAPGQDEDSEVIYSAAMNATPQHFPCKYLPCFYTGTGDIFSTLMVAYRLRNVAIGQAIEQAIKLIYHAIELSQQNHQPGAEGVNLEQILCREWDH